MEELKQKMIQKAYAQFVEIRLPSRAISFSECFTAFQGKIYFWFNTSDDSTHVIVEAA
jgi:hypothetical protein